MLFRERHSLPWSSRFAMEQKHRNLRLLNLVGLFGVGMVSERQSSSLLQSRDVTAHLLLAAIACVITIKTSF